MVSNELMALLVECVEAERNLNKAKCSEQNSLLIKRFAEQSSVMSRRLNAAIKAEAKKAARL